MPGVRERVFFSGGVAFLSFGVPIFLMTLVAFFELQPAVTGPALGNIRSTLVAMAIGLASILATILLLRLVYSQVSITLSAGPVEHLLNPFLAPYLSLTSAAIVITLSGTLFGLSQFVTYILLAIDITCLLLIVPYYVFTNQLMSTTSLMGILEARLWRQVARPNLPKVRQDLDSLFNVAGAAQQRRDYATLESCCDLVARFFDLIVASPDSKAPLQKEVLARCRKQRALAADDLYASRAWMNAFSTMAVSAQKSETASAIEPTALAIVGLCELLWWHAIDSSRHEIVFTYADCIAALSAAYREQQNRPQLIAVLTWFIYLGSYALYRKDENLCALSVDLFLASGANDPKISSDAFCFALEKLVSHREWFLKVSDIAAFEQRCRGGSGEQSASSQLERGERGV